MNFADCCKGCEENGDCIWQEACRVERCILYDENASLNDCYLGQGTRENS